MEKRVAEIETKLSTLEREIAQITEKMSASDVAAKPEELFKMGEEVSRREVETSNLIAEWDSLLENLN